MGADVVAQRLGREDAQHEHLGQFLVGLRVGAEDLELGERGVEPVVEVVALGTVAQLGQGLLVGHRDLGHRPAGRDHRRGHVDLVDRVGALCHQIRVGHQGLDIALADVDAADQMKDVVAHECELLFRASMKEWDENE